VFVTWIIQQEDIGQLQVRFAVVEKKLENASKEGDTKVDRLQQKLDDTIALMKKKEKYVCVLYIYLM